MSVKDVWDPMAGGLGAFVCKEESAPPPPPWLARVEALIAEALKHKGPLSGRKMLDDLISAVELAKNLASDLQFSRTRADEADKEVERLRAEAKDRAAELRRRDTQVIDLRVRVGEAGPPSLMKMSVELGLSRAKVEELEAELKRLKPDPEADEWLIWQGGREDGSDRNWWKALAEGYTNSRDEAHRYTKARATKIKDERNSLGLKLVHISMDSPE